MGYGRGLDTDTIDVNLSRNEVLFRELLYFYAASVGILHLWRKMASSGELSRNAKELARKSLKKSWGRPYGGALSGLCRRALLSINSLDPFKVIRGLLDHHLENAVPGMIWAEHLKRPSVGYGLRCPCLRCCGLDSGLIVPPANVFFRF